MDMNCILPAQLFEMPLSLRIAEKIIPQLQRSLVFAALVILSLPVNAMINPELLRTKALEDTTHTLEIIVTESDIKDTGEILV